MRPHSSWTGINAVKVGGQFLEGGNPQNDRSRNLSAMCTPNDNINGTNAKLGVHERHQRTNHQNNTAGWNARNHRDADEMAARLGKNVSNRQKTKEADPNKITEWAIVAIQ